ncbi:MAG: hypothetical protein KC777_23000 [Cyanobacteria bacterium HKST-UBA02]|nr:hypothetical protein [Cyanobacteria bacterium HKST-UBA02]
MTYQLAPLLVACAALMGGLVLGNRLARIQRAAFLRIPFAIALIALFIYGSVATSFLVATLAKLGLGEASRYIAVALQALVSGVLFGHLFAPNKPASKDDEPGSDGK